jgi:uncharacterized protein with GYD domain
MPTYISYCRWTAQGAQNVKDSPSRLDAARKGFESLGMKIKDFYMTTGRFDMAIIHEAPDDITAAKAMLSVLAKGSITSETVRAFNENEYRKIIKELP